MILTLLHHCSNQLFYLPVHSNFSSGTIPSDSHSNGVIRFSVECIREFPNTSTILSHMIFITSLLYPYPTETMGSYFKELTEMNSVKLFQFRLCYVIYKVIFEKSIFLMKKFQKIYISCINLIFYQSYVHYKDIIYKSLHF